MSKLFRTNSLSLPNRSIEEEPLRLITTPTSTNIPLASTSNLTRMSQNNNNNSTSTSNNRPSMNESNSTRLNKKRRTGRGRLMMVKVFYSLSSPRFPETSTSTLPSPAPVTISTPSNDSPYASTSAFLAVLDPSLAPPPITQSSVNSPLPEITTTAQQPQPHLYTCIARLSAPIWVQLLGSSPSHEEEENSNVIEYGKLTLKTCLSAICISRPELVTDPTKDYAVSAVDPYESSLNPTANSNDTSINSGRSGQGLMEGKGMLSWNLAEKREGTTFVCGRVIGDGGIAARRATKRRKLEENSNYAEVEHAEESEGEEEGTTETLEVWLQLVERPSFTQTQFLTSLRSFANPSHTTSDRASPPPPRQSSKLSSVSHTINTANTQSGDPVKRKRSRPTGTDQQSQQSRPQSQKLRSDQIQPSQLPRQTLPIPSTSITQVVNEPFNVASLQNPEVLGLLSQLFPNLATGNSLPSTSTTSVPAFSIDSPQGQALLPAIRTLAKFYGVTIPGVPTEDLQVNVEQPRIVSAVQEDLQVNDTSFVPFSNDDKSQSIFVDSTIPIKNSSTSKGKGKAAVSNSVETGTFEILVQEEADKVAKGGNYNPFDTDCGCTNCRRKKSATWRTRSEENGTKTVVVCNACGIYYNKHGHHRTKGDRNTSPAAPIRPLQVTALNSTSIPSSSNLLFPSSVNSGKPLQGRLTAQCESDLLRKSSNNNNNLKKKKKLSNGGGLIVPPSPSKIIGPIRSSPKSIFRHGGLNHSRSLQTGSNTIGGINHYMTSPVRSPRNRAMRGFGMNGAGVGSTSFSNMLLGLGGSGAATSPLRNSSGLLGTGVGLRSGYESGGLGGIGGGGGTVGEGGPEPFDFSTLYGGQQSPSPVKPSLGMGQVPEYLLTASPGTALKRILNDTNIDLNSFDILDGGVNHHNGDLGSDNFDADLDFYLRSTPEEEKENNNPTSTNFHFNSTGNDNYLAPPTTTDGPSTDFFDSVLSSLRRDFDTRLPTSNALTSPSSPVPSSPCVQPRTSSATPGQKSKAPPSSGRAPPSILDSFIDGLVPALALNHFNEDGDTPTESEGWTPLSGNGDHDPLDLDSILAAGAAGGGNKIGLINNESYNLSHLLRSSRSTGRSYLPSHLLGGGMSTDSRESSQQHQQQQQQHQQFDFGSLPPSSPPALPSEVQLTTPSDFDGITPDGRDDEMNGGGGGMMNNLMGENRTMVYRLPNEQRVDEFSTLGGGEVAKQEAIAALLASYGLPSKGALESQLLQMLENKGIDSNSSTGGVEKGKGKEVILDQNEVDDNEHVKMLYDGLF